MEGERIARALARIEAAAGRVERVAQPHRDDALRRKYEALRSEAGAALAELDHLIEALQP